jgi:hypothetical protein
VAIKFHLLVEIERAVAVGSSALMLPVKPFWFFGNMGKSGGEVLSHLPA